MHRQMPSIQRIWSGPGWFGTRRSMVQIHSPRPLLLANLQQRKVPTTSWLCAKRSVVPMSSPNDLHFPLQIGVKWRDAATTFSSFCSPRSPNRTGFGVGRLKPRPTLTTIRLTSSSTSSGSLDGIGARLDRQPELLFRLHKLGEKELISSAGRELPLARKGGDPGKFCLPAIFLNSSDWILLKAA